MQTVEEWIFSNFQAVFGGRFYPVIAPQNQEQEPPLSPFGVYNIQSVSMGGFNCGGYEKFSVQISIFHQDFNEATKIERQIVGTARDLGGKFQGVRSAFDPVIRVYSIYVEYDFLFNSGSLKGA